MADEWPLVPLGDLYDFSSGLSKPRSEFGFGYDFVTFKDVLDNYFLPDTLSALVNSSDKERAACSVKRGDIFLTRTSETKEDLGMSCVALREYPNATFNGFTKRLRPKDPTAIVPEYAGYYFRGPRFRQAITAMSSLSTRASLNNSMLERLVVVVPPPLVQAAIGRILKALDDKIELNRRMNATLEGISRAIFKSWFVDFDPVRQKAAGGRPVGMDAKIAAMFPDSFEESEIGEVPKRWQVEKLSEAMTFEGGSQPPASEFISEPRDGYVRLVQIRDFQSDNHITFVPDTTRLRKFTENDIMLARYGSSGNAEKAEDSLARVCRGLSGAYNVALVKVIPKRNCREFLGVFLRTAAFQERIKGMGARSVQSGFRKEDLNVIPVVTATDSVHEVFEQIAGDTWQHVRRRKAETHSLAALRDTLLPKLLSGEVRVPEAEEIVQESVR